jgi:hypothetical protein
VGEAAPGIADLAIRHYEMSFWLACDRVDDIAGAERYVDVGHVVLVEKCGVVRRNAHAKNADIGIFQDEMMVRFYCCGNGDRRLSAERKCEKKRERGKKRLHL